MKLAAAIAALALAALTGTAAPADAGRTTSCGVSGYNYAGIGAINASAGAAATIRALDLPQVAAGHVAAWVGYGGYGAGKGNTDAWLQVGIIRKAGEVPQLYWEVTRPGVEPELVPLGAAAVGRTYRVSVLEVAPSTWRAHVDGRPVSPAFVLPGSHRRWTATAVAESWDGGAPVCNRFRFAFADLASLRDGEWRGFGSRFRLQGGAYRLDEVTRRSFLALA